MLVCVHLYVWCIQSVLDLTRSKEDMGDCRDFVFS